MLKSEKELLKDVLNHLKISFKEIETDYYDEDFMEFVSYWIEIKNHAFFEFDDYGNLLGSSLVN